MEFRWVPIIQYISLCKHVTHPKPFRRTAVNLSFKILGDSPTDPDLPPVLLLHGLLGNKRHWESLGKTILNMTKRSVVAVDLRNHGDSPHVASHKYEELAEDVLSLYEKLGIRKASLIGHSMGGRTAMCVSLISPEKVAGLLVIDISPVSTSIQLKGFFPKIMSAMGEVTFKGTNLREAKIAAKQQLTNTITDDITMKAVLSNIKIKGDGKIGWACNLDILIKYFGNIASFPLSMVEKKYTGPVLFIGGQLSEYIPADDLPEIRVIFPQAVVTYVSKAGHNVQADDPKGFLELAIAFVRTNK